MKNLMAVDNIVEFLLESDLIENIQNIDTFLMAAIRDIGKENKSYVDDHVSALDYVLSNAHRSPTIGDVLEIHRILMKRMLPRPGVFRDQTVTVGREICPNPASVPYMIDNWIFKLGHQLSTTPRKLTSRELLDFHADYEMIHPFIDGNGRSGRLLWLWTKICNGDEITGTFLNTHFVGNNFTEKRQNYYNFLSTYRQGNPDVNNLI